MRTLLATAFALTLSACGDLTAGGVSAPAPEEQVPEAPPPSDAKPITRIEEIEPETAEAVVRSADSREVVDAWFAAVQSNNLAMVVPLLDPAFVGEWPIHREEWREGCPVDDDWNFAAVPDGEAYDHSAIVKCLLKDRSFRRHLAYAIRDQRGVTLDIAPLADGKRGHWYDRMHAKSSTPGDELFTYRLEDHGAIDTGVVGVRNGRVFMFARHFEFHH